MSSARMSLDRLLRRGRIQARRTARQVAFSAEQRNASSTFTACAGASSGVAKRTSFLEWYSAKLDAHPLLTKCITSGLIAATGDILCQAVVPADEVEKQTTRDGNDEAVQKSSPLSSSFAWDPWRTLRFAAVGTFWVAPAVHYWYAALTHRLLPGAGTPLRIAQRVAADQFCFGPVFTSAFMSILWLLEGRWQEDAKGTLDTLTGTMPGVLLTGWKVWIPAMTINFGFVPFKYQVLYSNVLSLFWNAYLSYMSSNTSTATVKDESVSLVAEPVALLQDAAAALLTDAEGVPGPSL